MDTDTLTWLTDEIEEQVHQWIAQENREHHLGCGYNDEGYAELDRWVPPPDEIAQYALDLYLDSDIPDEHWECVGEEWTALVQWGRAIAAHWNRLSDDDFYDEATTIG